MHNLYCIVGQSGSGKSTIADKLESEYGIKQVLSYTTRKPRYEGENTHEFITDAEFDKLTDMVAFTEFDGYKYCATAEKLNGCDTYIIDPKGVDTLKMNYTDKPLKIIYVKVIAGIRYERMKKRQLKNKGDFEQCVMGALERIGHDAHEFYWYEHGLFHIDFTIRNEGEIDDAVRKVYEYIQEEESRAEEETNNQVGDSNNGVSV